MRIISLASRPQLTPHALHRPDQLSHVDKLYLTRLAVPHLEMDTTFSAYSSFVTKFDNDHYGERLPAANKVYSAARTTMNEREEEEAKLVRCIPSCFIREPSLTTNCGQKKANYAEWAYLEYIRWETAVKKPAVPLVSALCERAVKDFPSSVDVWDTYLEFAVRPILSSRSFSPA
jgi:hypothetical protein